jgi:hypothetical protein
MQVKELVFKLMRNLEALEDEYNIKEELIDETENEELVQKYVDQSILISHEMEKVKVTLKTIMDEL